MNTIFVILTIILAIYGAFMTYLLYVFHKRFTDMEKFLLSLNINLNEFKISVDNLLKSNIMMYDETVFNIVNLCKSIKEKIDSYLNKYDDYNKYVFTNDIEEEQQESQSIGIFRSGPHG